MKGKIIEKKSGWKSQIIGNVIIVIIFIILEIILHYFWFYFILPYSNLYSRLLFIFIIGGTFLIFLRGLGGLFPYHGGDPSIEHVYYLITIIATAALQLLLLFLYPDSIQIFISSIIIGLIGLPILIVMIILNQKGQIYEEKGGIPSKLICPYCNKEIPFDSKMCKNCGEEIKRY